MALIQAYQNRGITTDITILDADEEAITVESDDIIRAVIGRIGKAPALEIRSDAPTSNGSSFTKNSPSATSNRLRLDAEDLSFDPGVYTLFISLRDDGDADDWKEVARDVFVLEGKPSL